MTTSPKKALALSTKLATALGWATMRVMHNKLHVAVQAPLENDMFIPVWTTFDYRDWNVIAPIAEHYGCFPWKRKHNAWICERDEKGWSIHQAETPQEAIAVAVVHYLTQGKGPRK